MLLLFTLLSLKKCAVFTLYYVNLNRNIYRGVQKKFLKISSMNDCLGIDGDLPLKCKVFCNY